MSSCGKTVVLAGRLASGKTTISDLLVSGRSDRIKLTVSDLIREVANADGLDPSDRRVLQDLGLKMTSQPDQFAQKILQGRVGKRLLIIDGLRSADVARSLIGQDPEVLVVFLEAPQDLRRSRYNERGTDSRPFDDVDEHPAELLAEEIRSLASVVVDASRAAEVIRDQIERELI